MQKLQKYKRKIRLVSQPLCSLPGWGPPQRWTPPSGEPTTTEQRWCSTLTSPLLASLGVGSDKTREIKRAFNFSEMKLCLLLWIMGDVDLFQKHSLYKGPW